MATSSKKSAVKANLLGKRRPEDDFETKPILRKHKGTPEEKETTEGFDQRVEFLETTSDQPNLISMEETVEGLNETTDFVEDVGIRNKTLFFGHISPQTTMSDIINFFENVEGVVRILLVVAQTGEHRGYGFIEFASAFEATEALQNKNGEYINDCKILIDGCFLGAAYFPPKFCIEHKIWDEDYILPDSLPMEEDDPRIPLFSSDDYRNLGFNTLFVANLSPQTTIPDIIERFCERDYVLSVRLVVNHEGKHVGYGFVEFHSGGAASYVENYQNGFYLHDHKIFLTRAASFPCEPQSYKYNLAEMLWYEDCLRRETLPLYDVPIEDTNDVVEKVSLRSKMLFVCGFSPQTEITHIINFFKDVGEVVYVRLIRDYQGKHVGHGYVEFASTNEANKALEKNGEHLHDHMIFVFVPGTEPYSQEHRCCSDYKVWYEDYLRQESLLIKEDEEDETLEELVEEVAERKKTLFVYHLPRRTVISDITRFFKDVAEVFRVRLIVDHKGDHVGCGFVEFASVNDAKKALQKKKNGKIRGRKIDLDVAKIAPYPLRPKYNCAEKIWYEDYLRRESCRIEEDGLVTNLETEQNLKKPREKVMGTFCGKKTIFSDDLDD